MKRSATGKRIELSPRDLAIFALLERYRYLRSTYIHAFVGGASQTRLKERLGDLYHEGRYLARPAQQWEFAGSRYAPAIYENDAAAIRVLREHGGALSSEGRPAGGQFGHTLMVCEILASIELGTRRNSNLRFVPWQEILAKAPEQTRKCSHPLRIPVGDAYVVPDGLFGLEYTVDGKKSYRFFAVEADRATMPVRRSAAGQNSYSQKFARYRDVLQTQRHKTHLGIPNLLVLNVTVNTTHMQTMMKQLEGLPSGNAHFLFMAIGADDMLTPANCFLDEAWLRVDNEPLNIGCGKA
jgi:hypothetical protein